MDLSPAGVEGLAPLALSLMTVKTGVRTIALDRRICVAREDRIDVRPSPGAFILPLAAMLVSISCFVVIGLTINVLPLWALALLLIPNVLVFPLAAMGLVYSLIGAAVIIDRRRVRSPSRGDGSDWAWARARQAAGVIAVSVGKPLREEAVVPLEGGGG